MPQLFFIRFLQPRGWTVVPENFMAVELLDLQGDAGTLLRPGPTLY
jgi:hypothetical protein